MNYPNLMFNWPAMIVAMVASFSFGFLWYGPICGKQWADAMGIKMDKRPDGLIMAKFMSLEIVGLFFTVYVLAHAIQIWRPTVWGVGQDSANYTYGLMCGFFTWIGYYVPQQFIKVTWEGRPNKLFFINAIHNFINLQIICQILAHWR